MNTHIAPIKVSVALPVYNEARTIASVLHAILKQEARDWELIEVLVYNDGSTDNTLEKIATVKDSRIRVINDGMRQGKTARLRQMFFDFKGDILCMFDGDLRLDGTQIITDLLKPFEDANVMLVGGNVLPEAPESFFQRSVFATFKVFYESRINLNGGNNIFGSGGILAIRHALADTVQLPNIFNEDTYLYLWCVSRGFKFRYVDSAKGYYKLPNTLSDYLRQAFRSHPEAVTIELKKYFGNLVDKEVSRPMLFYMRTVLHVFSLYPLEVAYMCLIHAAIKPLYGIVSSRYKLSWFTAASTH